MVFRHSETHIIFFVTYNFMQVKLWQQQMYSYITDSSWGETTGDCRIPRTKGQ